MAAQSRSFVAQVAPVHSQERPEAFAFGAATKSKRASCAPERGIPPHAVGRKLNPEKRAFATTPTLSAPSPPPAPASPTGLLPSVNSLPSSKRTRTAG